MIQVSSSVTLTTEHRIDFFVYLFICLEEGLKGHFRAWMRSGL